jgi:hypothetical protein
VVRILLSHGANVNARTEKGGTPLMHATYEGYADVVKIILGTHARTHTRARAQHATTRRTQNTTHMMLWLMWLSPTRSRARSRGEHAVEERRVGAHDGRREGPRQHRAHAIRYAPAFVHTAHATRHDTTRARAHM